MQVNFGGFVDTSTIDWPGKAVCTVFLRGCPLRCSYCHNAAIQAGSDMRDLDWVVGKIACARPLVSGVVFSGGEPTMQREALVALARAARGMGLLVGIQTNGYFPGTIEELLGEGLVDRVALDYKTRWEGYSKRWEGYGEVCKEDYTRQVRRSIALCWEAHVEGRLPSFEIVLTVFWGNEREVLEIEKELPRATIVLQQGVHKRFWKDWALAPVVRGKPFISHEEAKGPRPPLSFRDLSALAARMVRVGRTIKIRTRETGEVVYEGDRGRWVSCERQG
ncbi:MAG: anaerobic ribonucleoside-triphosphate reductase activating protein [Methanolinea sp.]|nr:anaerobic ribonucleoside-triphosphate reductase activating protein [Methanolinea sp.]